MKKTFTNADKILTEISVTNGFFDGGVGTLAGSNLATSSLSSTQKNYYYNLQYNSKDHFSVTYGHIAGSGSDIQNTTTEGTTQAIYKQFYNFTEAKSSNVRDIVGWGMIDGTDSGNEVTQSGVYIIAAERLQMKDKLNPGTWTMTLSGSNTAGAADSIKLTDDSKTVQSGDAPFGARYNIVSGSAGSIVGGGYTSLTYGFFYPDAGVMVLSANALSSSLPGTENAITSGSLPIISAGTGLAQDTRVSSAADNASKLALALQKGTVTMRSEEQQYIYDYFCRAKANEYNLSSNLTFWSGSIYEIRHSDMVTNPQTYISEVGLYDINGDMLAVGRLSSPINKNFSSEAIVKVRLTY